MPNEGEYASNYLYRLVLALSEREEIQMKAAFRTLSDIAGKMTGLTSNLLDSIKMPTYNIPPPPPNPQHTTNKILRAGCKIKRSESKNRM